MRVFSAVGARNCLHRLRVSVPLNVGSLPAMVPPKTEADQAAAAATAAAAAASGGSGSGSGSGSSSKSTPPPTADAFLYLNYDSILKTSVVTDFFVKHPRIMVPLLGFLFAAFTYLIFDPLRSWNITNFITQRFGLGELYAKLPWPFGWLQKQASELNNSSFFRTLRHGAGMDSDAPAAAAASTWSAREADEEKVRKWLNSSPDRILFLTGPKGAGKQALVKKLTADRKNVVVVDVAHMLDRPDDEFVKALSASVGFAPGFALITWSANIMDIFTPGASKASGSSTASSAQILKILECTSHALVRIASKENARRLKSHNQKLASRNKQHQQQQLKDAQASADANAVKPVDAAAAKRATETLSAAAAAMDSEQARKAAAQESAQSAPAVAEEQKKASQSATASTVSSLLGMMGGFAPSSGGAAPAAAAAKPEAGSAPAPAAAAPSKDKAQAAPVPANNNTEPLSRAPVVASSPAHVSTNTSPARLQDHSPTVEAVAAAVAAAASAPAPAPAPVPAAASSSWNSSRNAARMTEQQRNYDAFKQLQAQTAANAHAHHNGSGGASSDDSSSGDDDSEVKLEAPEPDNLPLFIIDGFNADNSDKHSNFLNVLVSWAAEMSAAGVARFVYLTDSALEESVSKQLPDVKLAEVVLSDATPEAAQQFLFASLPPHMRRAIPDKTTIDALKILGGRYNDLMQLVRNARSR